MTITLNHGLLPMLAASLLSLSSCTKQSESVKLPAEGLPEKIVLIDQSADLRALIANELAAGKKKIVIPPGRYRVQVEHGRHLLFKDLKDVEIIATNVEMVCTSTVQALGFIQCTNVTLRGLTIDYDPLPFTQGSITTMAPDKSWLEFEVATGYPENELEQRIQIYDPSTGGLRRGDAGWDDTIEALGGHRYRVQKNAAYQYNPDKDTEQVGDILVTNNRSSKYGGSHAVFLSGCDRIRFEDVSIYASPSFGFLERDSSASSYLRCRIDRRDAADDPIKRAQPRMRSLNADAYHSKNAAIGPAIVGCTARFMGDDAVNINGKYYYVSASHGNQLRIASFDEPGIQVGDAVEFLPFSGPRPPDAVAMRIEPDPESISEAEKAFIAKLRMHVDIRDGHINGKAKFFTLTLDREIVLSEGSAVCSALRLGNGFAVKDCNFGDNRSRGILIKASKGEVSGNRITHSRMAAVLISPEFWWLEAGCSSDVVVKDNIITGSLVTPIQILAPGGNERPLPVGAHHRISIINNQINDGPWPLIRVTSTSDLIVSGNILPENPPSGQPLGRDGKPLVPILLEDCETVKTEP